MVRPSNRIKLHIISLQVFSLGEGVTEFGEVILGVTDEVSKVSPNRYFPLFYQ